MSDLRRVLNEAAQGDCRLIRHGQHAALAPADGHGVDAKPLGHIGLRADALAERPVFVGGHAPTRAIKASRLGRSARSAFRCAMKHGPHATLTREPGSAVPDGDRWGLAGVTARISGAHGFLHRRRLLLGSVHPPLALCIGQVSHRSLGSGAASCSPYHTKQYA